MIIDQSSMKISKFVEIKVEDLKTDGRITFSDHNSVTARLKRQNFLVMNKLQMTSAVQEMIFLDSFYYKMNNTLEKVGIMKMELLQRQF